MPQAPPVFHEAPPTQEPGSQAGVPQANQEHAEEARVKIMAQAEPAGRRGRNYKGYANLNYSEDLNEEEEEEEK